MKKGVSYFYNTNKVKGTLTLSLLDKGDYTGTPTLYVGEEVNPTTVSSLTKSIVDGKIVYTSEVDNYFSIKDESSFAIYFYSLTVEAHE